MHFRAIAATNFIFVLLPLPTQTRPFRSNDISTFGSRSRDVDFKHTSLDTVMRARFNFLRCDAKHTSAARLVQSNLISSYSRLILPEWQESTEVEVLPYHSFYAGCWLCCDYSRILKSVDTMLVSSQIHFSRSRKSYAALVRKGAD